VLKTSLALSFVFFLSLPSASFGEQATNRVSPELREYLAIDAPIVALKHVRVIDGTGASAKTDQTIVIQADRISAMGPASSTKIPPGARVIEIENGTVMPGLVGMHDHFFYSALDHDYFGEMPFSFPRLYLAAGVTTIRTAGAMDPYTDLALAREIDGGRIPGPHVFVTGPFIEGRGSSSLQMHEVANADDARRTVEYWAEEGATSFKLYQHITRAELAAAIAAAHRRRLKVTGHLCSITFREAIEAGIDNIEHGPFVSGADFVAGKQSDACPDDKTLWLAASRASADGAEAQALIRDLVKHGVALTSTLPVFETWVPGRPPLDPRVLRAVNERTEGDFLQNRVMMTDPAIVAHATGVPADAFPRMFRSEMSFERAFVAAGGLLLAGCDPTGAGGILAGYGDQREIELLVEAGLSPVEAIHIGTQNGARFLGAANQFGSIRPGLRADLVVLKGDPTTKISDIENVEFVFKDGIGFDPHKLADSVRGMVGRR
jgi:imidazolonepropionase-like amidohydrolase